MPDVYLNSIQKRVYLITLFAYFHPQPTVISPYVSIPLFFCKLDTIIRNRNQTMYIYIFLVCMNTYSKFICTLDLVFADHARHISFYLTVGVCLIKTPQLYCFCQHAFLSLNLFRYKVAKVIHPKYYNYFKENDQHSHFDR